MSCHSYTLLAIMLYVISYHSYTLLAILSYVMSFHSYTLLAIVPYVMSCHGYTLLAIVSYCHTFIMDNITYLHNLPLPVILWLFSQLIIMYHGTVLPNTPVSTTTYVTHNVSVSLIVRYLFQGHGFGSLVFGEVVSRHNTVYMFRTSSYMAASLTFGILISKKYFRSGKLP